MDLFCLGPSITGQCTNVDNFKMPRVPGLRQFYRIQIRSRFGKKLKKFSYQKHWRCKSETDKRQVIVDALVKWYVNKRVNENICFCKFFIQIESKENS